MSSLRKSASFRSRIPVRRHRLTSRRCTSPPLHNLPIGQSNPKTSASSTIHKSKSYHSKQQQSQAWSDQRYNDSSSYSSSDESQESEAPLQRLLKQTQTPSGQQRPLTVSTDAISLDGLLDSVSSGSFSDPSSPVHFLKFNMSASQQYSSYDSLDKYNSAQETLKLTDNNVDKRSKLGYPSMNASTTTTPEYCNDAVMLEYKQMLQRHNRKEIALSNQAIDGLYHSTNIVPQQLHKINGMVNTTTAEKQRHLSDWYYIKSNPRAPAAEREAEVRKLSSYEHIPKSVTDERISQQLKNCQNEMQQHFVNGRWKQPERIESGKKISTTSSRIDHHHQSNASPPLLLPDYHNFGDAERTMHDNNGAGRVSDYKYAGGVPTSQQSRGGSHFAAKYKCPSSKHFGEMSSSSFEHVDVVSSSVSSPIAGYGGGGGGVCYTNQLPHRSMEPMMGGYESKQFHCSEMFMANTAPVANDHHNMLLNKEKYLAALSRPLPSPPPTPSESPTPDMIGVTTRGGRPIEKTLSQHSMPKENLYPPKSTSYRSECELSGSYVSLECPSPPGPPACLQESRRDPQARLSRYLKILYTELALKEPIIPSWAQPVTPGALSPARLEPELRFHSQSHGLNECISVDQLLTSVQTKEGLFIEAPRRILIECPQWAARSSLALRILYAWSKEPPWPPRGTPVALTLFIPLSELKKSFSNYVEKELLPKGPTNPFATGFGGFNSAWNSLESLGPKLLIVLDGYDNGVRGTPKRKGKNMPQDVLDLLEGKLFPEARVIVISVSPQCSDLLPLMQRHITYEGLTWGRSASLLGGGQWGAPNRLLDAVRECAYLRSIARSPLGCIALATIYDTVGGDLPSEEIDAIEAVLNCVAADGSQVNVAELGRLALFSLKMKRSAVTTSEIRMYCSASDAPILGCLDKAPIFGRTIKKKSDHFYTPICSGIIELLAANYLASLSNRPGLLAAEITGLSLGDELDADVLKILTFAMGLLGPRAHILLSKLSPLWLNPQTVFSLALASGDSESNLNALCDLLGISKAPPMSPLEVKPIWVQIRATPTELMGWALALKSNSCTLKNLELMYQLDKHNALDPSNGVEEFLEALSINESVTTLRITSLIENDVKEAEVNHLAMCISKALLKPRLENFELILTLLEEDPPVLKLQSVVTALCRTLPRLQKLGSILLDLSLCTSQLVQLCTTLEKCPLVTRLALPHLRCERGAIGALAALLAIRPLSSLALPSCWGARDDPPSSSGVSMGSGSGSSTGTSGLIKQSSLTGAPSPRSYPPGIFSSLPRGVLAPPTTMGRSATLPRQPIEGPPDKRSSDSVISKTWYPMPACDGGPHNSGTLHDLLFAAREPYSKLHGLDLSKAQLSLEDSMCLGETVRLSPVLHSLKLEGSSRLSEVLPAVLGAGESPSLQMLSLGSPRLALEDGATLIAARSLSNCATLRLLSLDGWSFRIESTSTLAAVRVFLSFTSVRELGLSNCRLHLSTFKSDSTPEHAYECRSVVVLNMAGAQVMMADHVTMRGPQMLPYLSGFPCLRELDLSAPARSGLSNSTSSPFILTDKCILNFFQSLHTQFGMLNTLKMCNWILHLDDSVKTLKMVSKCLRNSPLSHIKTDGISVVDRPKKQRIDPQFLHTLISSLPSLRWMGISLAGKKDDQITTIGNAVLELKGFEIDVRLSESTIESARLMAQAIGLDGKFDVRVSTFGTSSGILIHAEKTGQKTLNRWNRD